MPIHATVVFLVVFFFFSDIISCNCFSISHCRHKLKTLLHKIDVIREVEAIPLKKRKLIAQEFSKVVNCHNICKLPLNIFFIKNKHPVVGAYGYQSFVRFKPAVGILPRHLAY